MPNPQQSQIHNTHTHDTHIHKHIHTYHMHTHTHTHDTLGNEAIVGVPQGDAMQEEKAPMKGGKNSEEAGTWGHR